ncbi:MAG: potassium-transporting ATPase subunit F [Bacteroides sp.]|nr:potassium-transporting ATPase subunit F [Bacteroides sp.]
MGYSLSGYSGNAWIGLKRFKKERKIMYTALFVLGIAVFGYLMYVLVKPEKF